MVDSRGLFPLETLFQYKTGTWSNVLTFASNPKVPYNLYDRTPFIHPLILLRISVPAMAYIEKFAKMVEAEDDKDGMLTCGVELEFLVPSIQIGTEDPDPDITDLRLFRTSGNVQQMEYEVRSELRKWFSSRFSSSYDRAARIWGVSFAQCFRPGGFSHF